MFAGKRPAVAIRRGRRGEIDGGGVVRRMWVAGLMSVIGMFVMAGPVSAGTTFTASSYFVNKVDTTTIPHGPDYITVLSTDIVMRAGESRRVTDHVGVTLTNLSNAPELDNRVICYQVGNDTTLTEVNQKSAGTNYVVTGELIMTKSLLLHAETAGTYRCQIQMQTDDGHGTGYQAKVNPSGLPFAATGTYFKISSTDEAGSKAWVNDTCESNGLDKPNLTCRYIGGAGDPIGFDVFLDDVPAGGQRDLWTADIDATSIDVTGTFMITSCPDGTSSCVSRQWGPGGINRPRYAQVASFLEVNQLYPDGSVCRIHQSNDTDTGGVYYITNDQHHFPITYHVNAPVAQTCRGSRLFSVQVFFGWENGNPVKIDGGNIDAINAVRATTAPVPDVLRVTEDQANTALRAAGFLPVTVERVISPARPGTVVAENSPGGTVEPAGSQVELKVSLGQALVPRLIGEYEADAKRAITNANLTVGSVSHTNNCVDPGTVQTQNPSAGVELTPGSPVNIRVSTCTTGGGGGGGGRNGGGNPILPK